MIPKFRAWHKPMQRMSEVLAISYERQKVKIRHLRGTTHMTVPLDDVELMQSTGLVDKHGQEIWEGDIVIFTMRFGKRSTKSIGVVTFDKNELCFRVRNNIGGHYITFLHSRYLEVIGNIYENPELLEEVE